MKLEDYTEPHLILLHDLLPGGDLCKTLPDGVRDIAVTAYKQKRQALSEHIGGLELAWRRGYQAGCEETEAKAIT